MGVSKLRGPVGEIPVSTRWLDTLRGPGEMGLFSLMILASVLLTGCMSDIKMQVGRWTNVLALEDRLCVGQSTQEDVLHVLGRPTGGGRAMLPIHTTTKTVWTYWYEEGTMDESHRIILFVFFDDNRYGGYMWTSTFPDHKGSRGWDASQEENCP